ncbi:hypothetical protein BGZ60DRAFT_404481 [Tricladium varicosporioides]|nr:hypothetical protein BGZ60DRAFT_404481 [Hymenoscyphus varicosporioides]
MEGFSRGILFLSIFIYRNLIFSFVGRAATHNPAGLIICTLEISLTLLYVFILAGCTTKYTAFFPSNLLTITQHHHSFTSAGNLSIKLGYFGMCTSTPYESPNCAFTLGRSAQTLVQTFLSTPDVGPNSHMPVFLDESAMRMFDLAAVLQSRVFLVFLIIPSSLFFFSLILISLLRRCSSNSSTSDFTRQHILKKAKKSIIYFPLLLSVTCAIGTQQVASSLSLLSSISTSNIKVEVGMTLMVVQWEIVVLEVISAVTYWVGGCREEENGAIFLPIDSDRVEKWVGEKCEV